MQRRSLIVVFSYDRKTMLMCKRQKAPDQGKFNFVGGKIEEGEEGTAAARRELERETGITSQEIELDHLIDITYDQTKYYLEVYAGRLKRQVDVWGKENELLWAATDDDFWNAEVFAGDVGTIMEHVKKTTDLLK